MTERDEIDKQRATSEGMPQSIENERRDIELDLFLSRVFHEFKIRPDKADIEEAATSLVDTMSEGDKKVVVDVAKRHLLLNICHLHEADIVNDEEYTEGIREGDPIEGPLSDYELTTKTIGDFLAIEGRHSLRAHLKNYLSESEWDELENTEIDRQLDYFRYKGATSG